MANDITRINSARPHQDTGHATERIKDEVSPPSANITRKRNQESGGRHSPAAEPSGSVRKPTDKEVPINRNRVSEVRNAIARGEYSVDVERVADKLIDFESSLHDEPKSDR